MSYSANMNVTLKSHLAKLFPKTTGWSRENNKRLTHTVLLTGAELTKAFAFIADNNSELIFEKQRNTEIRCEKEADHVSGPASERPETQICFGAVWLLDEQKMFLIDGNTRIHRALVDSACEFEEVELKVYEVASRKYAAMLYGTIDSRKSVKQGKHDIQSLFRAAKMLPLVSSARMLKGQALVTPLKLLMKMSNLDNITPAALQNESETIQYVDSALLLLEPLELNAKDDFKAVFGGGELAGLMVFHKSHRNNPVSQPMLMPIMNDIFLALQNQILRTNRPSKFTPYYDAYVTESHPVGRSGSKVVPARSKHFQKAIELYLADLLLLKAAAAVAKRMAV